MATSSTMKRRYDSACSLAMLGLLVGVLTGLSSSPVVGSLVGTLATILVVVAHSVFGRSPTGETAGPAGPGQKHGLDLGGQWLAIFCLMCLFGVFSGVWIRTHNWLSPSVKTQLAWWTEAGYSKERAQQIVMQASMARKGNDPIHSVLFADQGSVDLEQLNPEPYDTVAAIKTVWQASGDPFLSDVANRIAGSPALDEDQKRATFRIIWTTMDHMREQEQ